MTNKNVQTPRGKHRGEVSRRERRDRAVVVGATAMALGASSLLVMKGGQWANTAMVALDDYRASQGPRIETSVQRLPSTLPSAAAEAIAKTTVKISYTEHNDGTGETVTGTGVAIRGGFLSAEHVDLKGQYKKAPCQNGMVAHNDYNFTVSGRATVRTETQDVAYLKADDQGEIVPTTAMSGDAIIPGDILYAASFQPVDAEQGRGPWELRTKDSANPDEFTHPVVAATISLGQYNGDELFLSGVKAYGQDGAAGEAYIDHGASGGGLYTESGDVAAVTHGRVTDTTDGDGLFTGRQVQRKYGLTLVGAELDHEYQIVVATPVNNSMIDQMAENTRRCFPID